MRSILLFMACHIIQGLPAQLPVKGIPKSRSESQLYVSMNLLSAAEPQLPLGASFGARLTDRTELFTEASYVTLSPFWDQKTPDRLRGARLILQYRYHFLQQWKPIFGFRQGNRSRHQPFAGIEFRWKPVSFQSTGTIVHTGNTDTISGFPIRGRATTLGFAFIMGQTFQLSSNGNWQLELTAGVGGKERKARLSNLPPGYQTISAVKREWLYIPPIEASASAVCFPLALRLRYRIR